MAFLFKEDWYFPFKIQKNYVKNSKKQQKSVNVCTITLTLFL